MDESQRESSVVTVTNVNRNLMHAGSARPFMHQALIDC